MSDPGSWTERTVPLPAARRHPAAAVAGVMGRSTQDACFIDDDGVPHLKPWAYCQGSEGHPEHRRITLHWPGCRVEVTGESLRSVYPLIMTRHAGLWRVFDARWHHPPPAGAAVIRSIRVIVTEETPAR